MAYINNNLQNLIVRNVIRPTQRYADMLEFSYHPNCFSNAIERKKYFIICGPIHIRIRRLFITNFQT
ncbi:DUF4135 domain-containing protein [Enterococcus sp. DIV0501]|uniref:DUF4135 domain-containing protein n=1 Tax=Enterococcus sp. DIV0501 TaxID=2774972 RepID=UPI003F686337